MVQITTKHIERSWTLLTIAGGALLALWTGYAWINAQNVADELVTVEIAPAVAELSKQTKALKDLAKLEREAKLITQVSMEQKCEAPGTTMPKDYCDDVLHQKRMREAHAAPSEVQP